jgi:hypothetical protein
VGDDPDEEREARPADRALQARAAPAGSLLRLQQKDFVAITRCRIHFRVEPLSRLRFPP